MNLDKVMFRTGMLILRLAILLLIIVGIFRVGEYSYQYCRALVSDSAMSDSPGRDVSVTLTGDMTTKELSELLEKKELIEDAGVFRIQLKLDGYEDALKPGTYVLNTSMTPKEMMAVMAGEVLETDEDEDE